MCYARSVTWGMLAAEVDEAMRSALPAPMPSTAGPAQERDLGLVMAQHIRWQETGLGPDRALQLPALFAVVRLIASAIDQLDVTVNGGPAPDWLRRPRRYSGALDLGDLLQHMVGAMCVHGHADLLARRMEGGSWRLDALHPSSVTCRVSSAGRVGLEFQVDGVDVPQLPAKHRDQNSGVDYLVHVPYLVSTNRPAGTSPVVENPEFFAGALAMERQGSQLLDAGTYSGGYLETDQELTDDQARRYRDTWLENRRLGVPPVFGQGIRYQTTAIDPVKAQFLEARLHTFQQIASEYGVPADMLGLTLSGGSSSLSYASAKDNNRRFRVNCLELFTRQIADALSPLLPPGRNEAEEQRLMFDYSEWEAATDADAEPVTD